MASSVEARKQYQAFMRSIQKRIAQGGAQNSMIELANKLNRTLGSRSGAVTTATAYEVIDRLIEDWKVSLVGFDYDVENLTSSAYETERVFSELSEQFLVRPEKSYGLTPNEHHSGFGSGGPYGNEAGFSEGPRPHYRFPKEVDTTEKLVAWAHQYFQENIAALEEARQEIEGENRFLALTGDNA